MDIKKVGIIGAGVMGIGISQNLAQKGFQVILIDVSNSILQHAEQEIRNNLRFQSFFNKNEKFEEPEKIFGL